MTKPTTRSNGLSSKKRTTNVLTSKNCKEKDGEIVIEKKKCKQPLSPKSVKNKILKLDHKLTKRDDETISKSNEDKDYDETAIESKSNQSENISELSQDEDDDETIPKSNEGEDGDETISKSNEDKDYDETAIESKSNQSYDPKIIINLSDNIVQMTRSFEKLVINICELHVNVKSLDAKVTKVLNGIETKSLDKSEMVELFKGSKIDGYEVDYEVMQKATRKRNGKEGLKNYYGKIFPSLVKVSDIYRATLSGKSKDRSKKTMFSPKISSAMVEGARHSCIKVKKDYHYDRIMRTIVTSKLSNFNTLMRKVISGVEYDQVLVRECKLSCDDVLCIVDLPFYMDNPSEFKNLDAIIDQTHSKQDSKKSSAQSNELIESGKPGNINRDITKSQKKEIAKSKKRKASIDEETSESTESDHSSDEEISEEIDLSDIDSSSIRSLKLKLKTKEARRRREIEREKEKGADEKKKKKRKSENSTKKHKRSE